LASRNRDHEDYSITQSINPEFNEDIVQADVFHDHRQTIQYIHPTHAAKLCQAELVVMDEAAAIHLPLVKSLLVPYLIFMVSTVNGYTKQTNVYLLEPMKEQDDLCLLSKLNNDV
jgi:N-acetyltransferase 10